ncbi:MAG: lipopolysaccharide heptosyltransferase II [Nitrospirota bacterium]|nr:MAG: lipopolysaccharide heptosyltransferase II [Nitrospirota bacterium]
MIRGVNWVGDAVMTMPAIRSIRDNFKDGLISLFVKSWVSELFRIDPNINDILEYKDEYRGITGKFRAARVIKKLSFDRSYLLQNAIDAALISFISRIPERIGYSRDGRGMLLSRPIKADKDILSLHHIDYYLEMLRRSGLDVTYKLPWIYPNLDDRMSGRNKLAHLKRPVIGLNPGAAYGSAKRWSSNNFAELAKMIISDLNGSVVLFGSAKEVTICNEIYNLIDIDHVHGSSLLDMSGKTTLYELCDLIPECDIVVSNDSGPMHICYASGTPLVALFGSTSPELTGPPESSFDGAEFSFEHIVMSSDIECSPCFERTCRFGHLKCMELIRPEDVFSGILDLRCSERAVFFDRDGTLCKDANYLRSYDDLEIFPSIERIKILKENGYKIIGITNQSGIARGIVDDQFVKDVNRIFIDKYGFDDFYYCPHHPDDRCSCRKPFHGMLLKARAEHKIDLTRSFCVGDKVSDMKAGKLAGCTTVFAGMTDDRPDDHSDLKGTGLEDCISLIDSYEST